MNDPRPTIPVRPETHRRVKVLSATEGKSLTDTASDLLDFAMKVKKQPRKSAQQPVR